MSEQIPVDSHASPVQVRGRVLNELCTHALETRPEECCGLVAGIEGDRFRHAYRCRNTMTLQHENDPAAYPRDGRQAYYMSELDTLRVLEEVEARGEVVTAVYHSHVAAGLYLSEMDQGFADHELFPFPEAAQIVLAVGANAVDRVLATGIFERDSVGQFRGRPVEAQK
ncbi:MAG: Mov34/MPN/PAD-1 family protein [Myxococcota bacterium]|nr:Mov34/MPN/PAD-1 family protein [Myxococcota bacterium]